jgi:FkbM family methyltransferase
MMSLGRRLIGMAMPEPVKRYYRRIRDQRRLGLYESLDLAWTLPSGIRLKLQSDSDWVMFCDIFLDGEYDDSIHHALCATAGADVAYVLDLGANSGFFTLRTVDQARSAEFSGTIHIVAVEGSPVNARRFARNLERAGLPASAQVRAVHGLIGEKSGVGRIVESGFGAMNHIDRHGIPVPYVDLGLLVAEWPRIDLLKCDIEGSEYEFLQNYADLLGKTNLAVFELHDLSSGRIEQGRQVLRSYGFVNHKLLRTCSNNTVEVFWR